MSTKKMLELRAKLKKKKPRFIRQDAHKIKRIDKSWRKPRGKDSKIKQNLKLLRIYNLLAMRQLNHLRIRIRVL